MDVSILIVSYNTRQLTLDCLRSVFAETKEVAFEVIVVDNQSNDGSAEAIHSQFPQARLIESESNLGFAGANNRAAGEATGDWLLLLNPDTVILDGAIQKAFEFAQTRGRPVVVGGRTFFGDMRLNANSCHGAPTAWSVTCKGLGLSSLFRRSRVFNPEGLGRWQRDTSRKVDCVTGCFLLIPRPLWVELGGFDLDFFMYGEDTDLCIRAAKKGARSWICPEARLIHYGGQSEAVRADKMVKLFRAKRQLFEKHWSPRLVNYGTAMLKLWSGSRVLALTLLVWVGKADPKSRDTWREIWRRRDEYASGS
jgi:GT2 family glycosyltransferase